MYSINKKKPEIIRKYLIYPIAEGLLLATLALFLTSVTAYFIYHHALAAIRIEIKDGLLRTVSGIASAMNGDQLASFDSPDKKDLPEYLETIAFLQKARLATKHCAYLYVNRLASNSVVFVVDPTPVDENGKPIFSDEKNLEPSIPLAPYPGASTELLEALIKKIPTVSIEPYTDGWGTFYSAYVPIFNKQKQCVGTLGADLKIDDMLARCKPIEEATKRAFFVSFVLALLFGTLIWFTRRFSQQLNESRFRLLENFIIAKDFADQTSVHIGNQLKRTAQIVHNVSQRLGKISEEEDSGNLLKHLEREQTKLTCFAEKLRDVGVLKLSRRELKLETFKLSGIQENLRNQLYDCCNHSDNLIVILSSEIPEALYGSIQTYEELLTQMSQFFLRMFSGPVTCRVNLLHEGNRDVILRQTMEADITGIEEQRLNLLQHLCREIEHEDFFEEIELAEAVSVSIARDLIYLINSDIKVEIVNNSFLISFDSVFQKTPEDQEEEDI